MSGTIIKASDTNARTKGLYSLDLRDISQAAESILESARAEAKRIVEEARHLALAEREKIAKMARDEGQRQGVNEGLAKGKQEALAEAKKQFQTDQAGLLTTLSKTLSEFIVRREQFFSEARRDVVVLAIVIASRICERLTRIESVAPEIVEQACREALALIGEATEVRVRVHPQDAASIELLAQELAENFRSKRDIRLVEDAQVGRGGVSVELTDGKIDATVNARVERVADEIVSGWRDRARELGLKE